MFSLAFSLFLAFAGLFNLIALNAGLTENSVRRLAGFNTLFWTAACGLFVALHPVTQPILISGVTAVLFALAYWRSRAIVQSKALSD